MNLVSRSQQRGQVRNRSRGPEPVAPVPTPKGSGLPSAYRRAKAERRSARAIPYVPKGVEACVDKLWHIRAKKTGGSAAEGESCFPFRCTTWRCPNCRRGVASVDFARIQEALQPIPVEELLYFVGTLPKGDLQRDGMSKATAYKLMWRKVQSLIQWLRRRYKKSGPIRYVLTLEQHRDGWPHVNIIFHCPGFAAELAQDEEWVKATEKRAPSWLKKALVRVGLGPVAWVERPHSKGSLTGYIVKLAHHGTLTGEVTKLNQLPVDAPLRTRRLRSSKGFLPKRKKQEGWTGELVRKPLPPDIKKEEEKPADHRLWNERFGFETKRPNALRQDAQEPQGGPKGGEAPAQPPTGDSGGRGEGRGVGPRLVTTRISHSPSDVPAPQLGTDILGVDGLFSVLFGFMVAKKMLEPKQPEWLKDQLFRLEFTFRIPWPPRPSLDRDQKPALSLVPHSSPTVSP